MWVVTLPNHLFFLCSLFQSTPPVWVVTRLVIQLLLQLMISIHTTRVGGDANSAKFRKASIIFQSTPPVWVVTVRDKNYHRTRRISIHTTRVGGDRGLRISCVKSRRISIHTTRVGGDRLTKMVGESTHNFNPHHPCGW